LLHPKHRRFYGKKIGPDLTLKIIEDIAEDEAEFVSWEPSKDLHIIPINGFSPDFDDKSYRRQFTQRMEDRIKFVRGKETEKGGFDKLPSEAMEKLQEIIAELK